jgi:hypothetical protein
MDNLPVVFLDMKERNNAERDRLAARRFSLEQQKKEDGELPPDLEHELEIIIGKLAVDANGKPSVPVVDPFYGGNKVAFPLLFGDDKPGVREVLGTINPPALDDHVDGVLPNGKLKDLDLRAKALAAAYGLMEADNLTNPELDRFVPAVSIALGEYTASQRLFDKVLVILAQEGRIHDAQETEGKRHDVYEIRADQWAQVVRDLRAEGVSPDDPYLPLKTRSALAREVGGSEDGAAPSSISIDLPDLEAAADIEIQGDNLQAMEAIYFAAMLEDLKLFQVVDKLVELFQSGMLPLGKGNAGNFLFSYWKKSVNRFTEIERRNLYARTFGFPGGEATQETINREFSDLWLRFVSAVSSFVRQFTVDELLRARIPISLSQEQVRKSGRDLAANLSLHGYGIAYFAATEFQNQIGEIITLLSDPEIKTAYGARDMWQVVDQVATLELGGAKNSVRQRTMATAGAVIIRWLAEHAEVLSGNNQVTVLNVSDIRNPSLRPKGVKATVAPTDKDLVDACDQWLAVTGTQEKSVEEYAQPVEGPNLTSRPIQIPRVAQDLLESVGIRTNGKSMN